MNHARRSLRLRSSLRTQAASWVLVLATTPVLAFAGTASAQQAPPAAKAKPVDTVQEVVVTARRVTERLQDVPQAVAVIPPTTLRDNHIQSLLDIKGIVPNLYQARTSTLGGGLMYIRGIISQGLPNATLDTRVGVYIDGVYMARSEGINAAMADIAAIEVDKGPQGTLFGRNVTAGAIAFTTQGPTGAFGGEMEAGLGNLKARRFKATLNLPEWNGLSTRFTYRHDEQEGDVRNLGAGTLYGPAQQPVLNYSQASNPSNARLGGHDNDAFFFAARYAGIDKLTIDYKFDYSKNRESAREIQTIGMFPSAPGCIITGYYLGLSVDHCLGGNFSNSGTNLAPTLFNPNNAALSFKKLGTKNLDFAGGAVIKGWGHTLTSQYQITDTLMAKNITSYRELTAIGNIDTDGEYYLANPAYFNAIAGSPQTAVAGQGLCGSCSLNRQSSRQFSEELQFIGKWGSVADYIFGGYYFNEHTGAQSYYLFDATPNFTYFGQAIPPLGAGPTLLNLGGFSNGEFEHFASKSYAAFGHVTLHLSNQIDISGGLRYTKDNKTDHVPLAIVTLLKGQGLVSLGTDPNVKYNKLNYDATLTYKVTPDVNIYGRYATAYLAGGFYNSTAYVPENTKSGEVGVKSEWLERRLRLNADVFYQSTRNSQDTGQSTGGGIYVANILGTTTNKGFEVDSSFVPITGLTFDGSVGYTKVKFADERQNSAPEWTAAVSAQFDAVHFGNGMYVSFKADGNYRSRAYNLHYSAITAQGGYTAYDFTGPAASTPGTPEYNYKALLSYLGYSPTTNPNAELQYVTALNRATEGEAYWLTNLRVSVMDIPVAGTKARASAYVKNVFNERATTDGSNYGGYFGSSFEEDRTYGIDVSVEF
jgi:iron complex outermembrane receptor protein